MLSAETNTLKFAVMVGGIWGKVVKSLNLAAVPATSQLYPLHCCEQFKWKEEAPGRQNIPLNRN